MNSRTGAGAQFRRGADLPLSSDLIARWLHSFGPPRCHVDSTPRRRAARAVESLGLRTRCEPLPDPWRPSVTKSCPEFAVGVPVRTVVPEADYFIVRERAHTVPSGCSWGCRWVAVLAES